MKNNIALSKFFKIIGIITLIAGLCMLIYGIYVQISTFVNYIQIYEEWARGWSLATEHLRPSMPMFCVYIPMGFIIIFISICLLTCSKMLQGNIYLGGKQD